MARRNGRNGTLDSLAKLDAWFTDAEAAERRTRKAPDDPIAADLIDGLKDAVLAELRQCDDPNALVCALTALRKS